MWSSLAASLAIHGIAVAGLVLSAQPWSPDAPGGERAPGGGSPGGPVMVRLLGEPAVRGQAVAEASLPQAEARRVQPPPARAADPPRRAEPRRAPARPAPAIRPASDEKRAQPPAASPLPAEDPVETASAPASAQQPLPRPVSAAGSPPSQAVAGLPSRAAGPGGGPLASAALGPGNGEGAGRLDRVARPVGTIHPHYPARARQRGEEADVTVEVRVGAQGNVDRVAVSRSAGPDFDAAALAAVQEARFHPALRDGKPVASLVALRLHFRLE